MRRKNGAVAMSISIPSQIYKLLLELAEVKNTTVSSIIRSIIERHMDEIIKELEEELKKKGVEV